MFPIPDPSRLLPQKLPQSGGYGKQTLPEQLLTLAAIPMLLAFTIGGGAIANTVSSWLTIPAGLLGFGLAMGIMENTLLCGIVAAVFYAGVAFLFSGGLDSADQGRSIAFAIIVALLFLATTFFARRSART